MRKRLVWLFIGCLLAIPCMGTQIYQNYRPSADWEQSAEGLTVHMKEFGMDRVVGFDEYAVGVLAAVLDTDTQEETVKAMAVVLRTYIAYMSEDGRTPEGQWLGQPWLSAGERLAKGMDEEKLRKALAETEGRRILYDGVPILPLYCPLSNGKTRNFADVWGGELPYLVSVDSAWDKGSADYMEKVFLSRKKSFGVLRRLTVQKMPGSSCLRVWYKLWKRMIRDMYGRFRSAVRPIRGRNCAVGWVFPPPVLIIQ